MSGSAGLRVNTLGVPRIFLQGQPLEMQGKNLAILAYLAVQGETSREELADLLWSDQSGEAARRNLRVQLHRLRQTAAAHWLLQSAQTVRLRPETEVDVQLLRAALAAGDFQTAARFAQGNFLDHLNLQNAEGFDAWRTETATTLRDEQWRALDAYAQQLVGAGQFDAALSLREQAVRLDPLRERSVRALMELLISMRQFDAAQNAYISLAQRLHDEVGLSPLPATQALRDRIEVLRASAPQQVARAGQPSAFPMPLVGREAGQVRLENSAVMLVLGEAGVGKSRLVQETAGREALVLRAVPELTPLPFGALFELLRSQDWQACPEGLKNTLRPVLEEAGHGNAPTDRATLLDALAQALNCVLEGRTLIVEDIHWADLGTLECVFLALFRGARRVWLTARWSELQERAEVLALLLARKVPRLTLNELSQDEVGELIRRLAGQQAPLFSRRLYSATAGNPLFLVETLRVLRENGELNTAQGVWQTPYDTFTQDYAEVPVPQSVSAAIGERAERLGTQTRQLLQTGALWGEEFPAELVAAACGLDTGAALDALERAETARLVIPNGSNFRFGHDLYRREMMRRLSGPRRRFLHSQLARLAPPGTPPVQVAEHHEQAGEPSLAWPHWKTAALEAERLFAHAEAIALYQRALADLPPDREQFELGYAVSQLQRHLDDTSGQERSLAQLRQLAERLDDPLLHARCARRSAVYFTECDQYELAVQEAQRALERVGHLIGPERRAELLLEGGAALACLRRWDQAHTMLLSALAESRDQAPQVYANTLYWVGFCRVELGDAQGAEAVYRESLDLIPAGPPSRGRILKLWKHGMTLRLLGRLDEARQELERARAEAETLHAGVIEGLVMGELGLTLLALGDVRGARHLADLCAPLIEEDAEGGPILTELRLKLSEVQGQAVGN